MRSHPHRRCATPAHLKAGLRQPGAKVSKTWTIRYTAKVPRLESLWANVPAEGCGQELVEPRRGAWSAGRGGSLPAVARLLARSRGVLFLFVLALLEVP